MVKRMTLLTSAVAVCAATTLVLGHGDDPKGKSMQKPWPGPGYRAAEGGAAGVQFDAQAVTMMSWITLGEFSAFHGVEHQQANDCWGYTSPSGREYAIIGLWSGTGFVEITDPANARIVAVEDGPTSTWRDFRTYQTYAYAVSEGGGGIQVFDLSEIDDGVVTHVTDIVSSNQLNPNATHNIALNEESGTLYRCGGGGFGLRWYNLDDPANPDLDGHWQERYVHDATVVTWHEGEYEGREIAFCCGGFNNGWVETGLDILDLTGPGAVEVIARLEYSLAGYSHQAWLSPDRKYLYLDDEFDEGGAWGNESRMIIIDISDLENPVEVGSYTNGIEAVTHNHFARWNLVFAANYSSGLRVFNVDDPENPYEVGFFDTQPDYDGVNFDNLWGTYPFFPSGTVIGSDREKGLFVWQLDESLIPDEGGPDVNADGAVDVLDLVEVITSWGPCPPECPADIDGDGTVGVADLVAVILAWS